MSIIEQMETQGVSPAFIAAYLVQRWLRQNIENDVSPTAEHELMVEQLISYRQFFIIPRRKLMSMSLIHHFWGLPESNGNVMIAQNTLVAIRVATNDESGKDLRFLGEEWKFHRLDDEDIPSDVLSQIITMLKPLV